MEAELREAFREIGRKIDGLAERLEEHRVEEARWVQQVDSSTKAAHHRLDEVEKKSAGRISLWIGVLVAFVTGLCGIFAAWIGGKKP